MKRHLVVACLFFLFLFPSPTLAQLTWQRDVENPVLPEWSEGINDPTAYKYLFEPGVIYDQNFKLYRCWFISLAFGFGTRFCVSEAISPDGRRWYTYAKNPVLEGTEGGFDNHLRAPKVVFNGSDYKMYYTGWTNAQRYRIGLATSTDGKTWTRSPNPILALGPTGSWDSQDQLWCDVRYENGTYTMWYTGSNPTTAAIGVATSTDGFNWTKHPNNPVFQKITSGWDSYVVCYPMITKVDSIYYMIYRGNSTSTENFKLGAAYSSDGISWTRASSSPVFQPTSGWEGVSLDGGTLLFRENKFRLWYCALSSVTAHWQTGYATADRGPLGVTSFRNLPERYSLSQPYPNPFNPETVFEYSVTHKSRVSIKVFDMLGKEVETLVDEQKEAGTYSVRWKPTVVASGVYWCRMNSDGFSESRKVVLLK